MRQTSILSGSYGQMTGTLELDAIKIGFCVSLPLLGLVAYWLLAETSNAGGPSDPELSSGQLDLRSQAQRGYRYKEMATEHMRVNYPQGTDPGDVEALIRTFEANLSGLKRRLASNQIAYNLPTLEIFINESTGDFVGRTGQPWRAVAATKGNRIELQPLAVLRKRMILETTIRHELVHVLIDMLGSQQTPRWLAEGLAIYVAGEGALLQGQVPKATTSGEELDQALKSAKTSAEMKAAYAKAYYAVRRLVIDEGEAGVWQRLTAGRH